MRMTIFLKKIEQPSKVQSKIHFFIQKDNVVILWILRSSKCLYDSLSELAPLTQIRIQLVTHVFTSKH